MACRSSPTPGRDQSNCAPTVFAVPLRDGNVVVEGTRRQQHIARRDLRQHVSRPAWPKTDRPALETESPRRHRRPFGHLAAEPSVDVHYYHLRALTKTFGDKGFEHCGEIPVSGRLRV